MNQRPKLGSRLSIFLVLVIFFSFITSALTPVLVSAAENFTVKDRAEQWNAANWLRACFYNNAHDALKTPSDSKSGDPYLGKASGSDFDWFGNQSRSIGSMLTGSSDGSGSCSDRGKVKQALQILRWDSPWYGLLCALNYRYISPDGDSKDGPTSTEQCVNGDTPGLTRPQGNVYPWYNVNARETKNDGQWPSSLEPLFRKVTNKSQLPQTGAMRYHLYWSTFEKGCSAQLVGSDQAAIGKANQVGQNEYVKVRRVLPDEQGNPTIKEVVYKSKGGEIIDTYVDPNGNNQKFPCAVLAQMMNRDNIAEDYLNYMKNSSAEWLTVASTTDSNGSTEKDKNTAPGEKVTCFVEAIGWIVCPVVQTMAKITDGAYGMVSQMLEVKLTSRDSNSMSLYDAWTKMRNIANVLFAVVFIVIIYSQITSMGISNYGIKKMVPKLVITAILVNLSYWLCVIAVDASNIIGASLNGIFGSQLPTAANATPIANTGSGWAGIAGGILAGTVGGAMLYAGLSVLLPVLVSVLVTIVTIFVGLVVRQALIILLIVVSPLAFVAYLLPNTEGLFKKWKDMFKALLIVYPIVGLLFGASGLASAIIMTSSSNVVIQIAGAAAAILPLFLIKSIISGATSIIQRVTGIVNNPNKGPFDRAKKSAERAGKNIDNRRAIQALENPGRRRFIGVGHRWRRQAKERALDQSLTRLKSNSEQQYVAQSAIDDKGEATRFGRQLAGANAFGQGASEKAIQSALANAQFTIEKAEIEEVKAASALIKNFDATKLKEILDAPNESKPKQAAALERMIKIGDVKSIDKNGVDQGYGQYINKFANDTSRENSAIRETMSAALSENGPKWLKGSDFDNIRRGTMSGTMETVAQNNIAQGAYSPAKMVDDTHGNLAYGFEVANLAGKQKMVDASHTITITPELNARKKQNSAALDAIAVGKQP